jgi:hypothetical protein
VVCQHESGILINKRQQKLLFSDFAQSFADVIYGWSKYICTNQIIDSALIHMHANDGGHPSVFDDWLHMHTPAGV